MDGPNTTGLQRVYRLRTFPLARRLTVGALSSTAAATALRVLDGPREGGDVVVAAVLVVLCVTALVLQWRVPPALAVSSAGVRIRSALTFGPLVPWAEVADVRAPGRWDEHASIRLPHRGQLRRTTLLGMPEPDARRLAEAFAQWRATSGHPFGGSRSR